MLGLRVRSHDPAVLPHALCSLRRWRAGPVSVLWQPVLSVANPALMLLSQHPLPLEQVRPWSFVRICLLMLLHMLLLLMLLVLESCGDMVK